MSSVMFKLLLLYGKYGDKTLLPMAAMRREPHRTGFTLDKMIFIFFSPTVYIYIVYFLFTQVIECFLWIVDVI